MAGCSVLVSQSKKQPEVPRPLAENESWANPIDKYKNQSQSSQSKGIEDCIMSLKSDVSSTRDLWSYSQI